MYLVDDEMKLFLEKENILLNYVLSPKILKNGKVIHYPKFMKEFKNNIKKDRITKYFNKNILIWIVPPNFYQTDKEIIRLCFDELPFQELKIIKETNLYQWQKNLLWINLNKNYEFLSYTIKTKKEIRTWEEQNLFSIYEQIDKIIKNNPNIKKIIIIGNNLDIPEITTKLEKKYNKITLYYENYQEFIITTAIKHNL